MTNILDLMANQKLWVKLTLSIWFLLLISWPLLIVWQGYTGRQEAIDQARASSASIHEATLIGLTCMMLTGTVAQRSVLLDQIRQLPTVNDLRVIRAAPVIKLFGPGTGSESNPNEVEKGVLTTGAEFSAVLSDDKGEYLQVARPVIGKANYLGKNCLQCHLVPEGTLLGVVSMKVSMGQVNEAFLLQTLKSIVLATLVAFTLLVFRHSTQGMDATVTRVGEGAAKARQAGDAINQIKSGVDHVVSAVNEISASLKEQAQSNSENSNKVKSIARLSEENNSAFQDMAKTVKYIDELARNLGNLVGRFRV